MNKLLSCEFNIDTGNVECRFADGTMISIDCDVVEDTIDGTLPFVRVRTELECSFITRHESMCSSC